MLVPDLKISAVLKFLLTRLVLHEIPYGVDFFYNSCLIDSNVAAARHLIAARVTKYRAPNIYTITSLLKNHVDEYSMDPFLKRK
jgi:hypothetical protein